MNEREETRMSCGADNRDKPVERSDRHIGRVPITYTNKSICRVYHYRFPSNIQVDGLVSIETVGKNAVDIC